MAAIEEKIETIKKYVKRCPDFPKPGILFSDLCPILHQPEIFKTLLEVLVIKAKQIQPPAECVAAVDARGFLYGPLIALELKVPFIPIRKKGKLPGKCVEVTYALEYNQDTIEIQAGSIKNGQNVIVMDDVLATGGTLKAACELVKKVGGNVTSCLVIIEKEDMRGRDSIPAKVEALMQLHSQH